MIVIITTRGNDYTLRSLADGTFGVPLPHIRLAHYDQVFGRWRFPRATYIFADLERLAPWELRIASDLYFGLVGAGLICLNNPARAMARVELLTALRREGINPFAVYRADQNPRPSCFPVFIRSEGDHARASDALYEDQGALDQALDKFRNSGVPLRGMLVVEHAAEPCGDNLWAKWGTWRIGDRMIVEHVAVDDRWLVKVGDHSKVTDAMAQDEREAVEKGRFAEELRRVFDIAMIDFGRADHSNIGGRSVVYEINTNPSQPAFPSNEAVSFRRRTLLMARAAMADAFKTIDTEGTDRISVAASAVRRPIRWWKPGFVSPRRP